ncbi:hypothetical protein A2U01_0071167, partial [Trifolium medium]|nr:hypothetical protein [Trifolium medium]
FKSKGNEETQTASDAGLHQLPAVSAVVEEKASDNKSC